MRYRVRLALWETLAVRRISMRALAAATPNSQQWLSRLYCQRSQTVSERWAMTVCLFLDMPLAALFEPVPVTPRQLARDRTGRWLPVSS